MPLLLILSSLRSRLCLSLRALVKAHPLRLPLPQPARFFPLVSSLALFLLAWSAAAAEKVVLSEFMASNKSTLLDGSGNPSDWIELYNSGDTTANLAGWHLTDDILDLAKWAFPSVTLGPGKFLLVFASGNGVPDARGNLHANFQLTGHGEYLALVRPDNSIATQFSPAFPEQFDDIAYGFTQQ